MLQSLDRETPRSVPILLAEGDPSMRAALTALIEETMPEVAIDVCHQHHVTMRKLSASPYQVLISSVPLLRIFDFFLTNPHQVLQPHASIIVTAERNAVAPAAAALERGAFDIILNPLNKIEALGTIRIALWRSKLKRLVTSKAWTLEQLRYHLSSFPEEKRTREALRKTLARLDERIAIFTQTIETVEKSLVLVRDLDLLLKNDTKQNALARLNRNKASSD